MAGTPVRYEDPLDLILTARFNDHADVERWFFEHTRFSLENGTRIVRVLNEGTPTIVRMQGRDYIMLECQIQSMLFRDKYIIAIFRSGFFGLAIFNGVDRFLFSGFFNCPAYAGITLERQLRQKIFNPKGGEMAQAFGMGHRNFFENVSVHPAYRQEMRILMDRLKIVQNPRLPTHPRHHQPALMLQQDVQYAEQVFYERVFRNVEEVAMAENPQEAEQLPQQHNPQDALEELLLGNPQDAQEAIFQANPMFAPQILVQVNPQAPQVPDGHHNIDPQQPEMMLNLQVRQPQDAQEQVMVMPQFEDEAYFDFLGDINAEQELFIAELEDVIFTGSVSIPPQAHPVQEQRAVKKVRMAPY